jgi:3-phytase
MKMLPLLGLALLAGACATDTVASITVPALRETAPMTGVGDRADDPAVWTHPTDVARSLILGTNKDEGLHVYNLEGEELQKLPVGMVNNVDVRDNIAAASNDQTNGVSWFRIDPATRMVTHVGDAKVQRVEPYGICVGKVDGKLHTVVTYKDGAAELWAVKDGGTGLPEMTLARTVQFGGQLEGCVFDDEAGRLFVGQEEYGLWAVDLNDAASRPVEIDSIAKANGLVADVEGMSIYIGKQGAGYLVVSAQSADRYVIYDREPPHAVMGVIKVGPSADGAVDAVSHTDGLDVSSAPLPDFPAGVLVVQDDANPVAEVDQNFKIVDWREVEKALAAPKAE